MGDRAERGIRAAAVAAGLLALLAIVGLASNRDRPQATGATDVGAVAQIRDVILSLGLTLYALGAATVLALLWWAARRRSGPLPERRGGLAGFLAFMILAGAVVGIFQNRATPRTPEAEERAFGPEVVERQARPGETEAEPIPPARFRWDVAIAVAAAVAAAAAGAAGLVARRRRALEREALSPHDAAAAELAAVVESTLADLRREPDPRRAVIAAYAQMERTVARHGLPRRPAEAPFEFLARILRELRVRAAAALALTELFERARFSPHVIDAAMKDEAIEALVAVRDDLKARAA